MLLASHFSPTRACEDASSIFIWLRVVLYVRQKWSGWRRRLARWLLQFLDWWYFRLFCQAEFFMCPNTSFSVRLGNDDKDIIKLIHTNNKGRTTSKNTFLTEENSVDTDPWVICSLMFFSTVLNQPVRGLCSPWRWHNRLHEKIERHSRILLPIKCSFTLFF